MIKKRLLQVPGASQPREVTVAEGRINKGMVTIVDPADIPTSAVKLAKNVRCRYDGTSRRPDLRFGDVVKPNSQYVLKIASFKLNDGTYRTIRFTADELRLRSGSVWAPITGTLSGGNTDRIQAALVNNKLVFTNNGADEIQIVDDAFATFGALGNAPKYRYLTGFYDRVVAAHRVEGGSYGAEVGWSALGDFAEWDNSVKKSAGNSPISDSPSDLGDNITGIFGMTGALVIPRERSIWIGTKNPSGSNPFSFYNRVPNKGIDLPNTIVNIGEGIVGVDGRYGTVFAFAPGASDAERIGTNIEDELIRSITDPELLFAGFNSRHNEYSVCIPVPSSSTVKQWTYSFNTQSWVYDEYEEISSLDEVDFQEGVVKVDDLVGKVDDLIGKVDDLGASSYVRPVRVYGLSAGDYQEETDTIADDAFESVIESKLFQLQTFDETINRQRYEFQITQAPCTIELYSSKNGSDWKLLKAFTFNDLSVRGNSSILTYIKNILARQFQFKLVCSEGNFVFTKYELKSVVGGESKQ